MRAALFYNPLAGRDRAGRARVLDEVCAVLAAQGFVLSAISTQAAGSAGQQVREAVSGGAEYIFACGGDGTVHDVLQGLVDGAGGGGAMPVLGVIPMGSANALARHLKLSMYPVEAARQLTAYVPRLVPAGKIQCDGTHRYFCVMAGAGPDGALVYKMLTGSKRRLGRLAYYAGAASLFSTRRFPAFDLEFTETASGNIQTMRSVAAMTVRIDDLGGLFGGLVGDAAVHHTYFKLIAVRPPGLLSLPLWFIMGWLGLSRLNPLLYVAHVDSFACTPLHAGRVHIQADGEWIGRAPMRVTLVPDAIRLLMPPPPKA